VQVRLDVFNVLGQTIATLVDAFQVPGRYRVRWQGVGDDNMPVDAGVYFCRLQAGRFVQIRKMTLVQ
jgi:hypothetical protein